MRVWVLSCIGLLGAALPAAAQQTDGSPHGKLPAGMDCIACHTSAGWRPMRAEPDFDHAKQARFELSGKHALLGCKSCHTDARFDRPRAGARDCVACHVDLHQGRLSRDCASCHNPESFARPAGSDVHSRTRFP
ncbi:MAG TPA: hypothetical protein VK864_07205, partial [Longimicrobiales bacterium]|nr:hypothetical protein [Longimicrobiales bacterium]